MNKRFTFKGVINAQQQKLPQKSRSRSNNRSKASSISKNISITNRSTHSNSKSTKVQPRTGKTQNNPSKTQENIFRSTKRSYQQELMKKIIKLKNSTIQLQNTLKQKGSKNASMVENKENEDELTKMESMQNFLEEFDLEIRKQTKEIGDYYLKQLQDLDPDSQEKLFQVPQFKPLSVAHSAPIMTALESKLQQIESSWFSS